MQFCARYVEIETNGTQTLDPRCAHLLQQINISPKLKNSGEPHEKAYLLEILKSYASLSQSFFKFVVSHPDDVDEVIANYQEPLQLPLEKIWLMPEGGTRDAIQAKTPWIIEACKQYGFQYTPRLQIDIWNEVTGV